jgi:hypothetical protein
MYPEQFFEVRKAAIKRIGSIWNIQFRILLIGEQIREIQFQTPIPQASNFSFDISRPTKKFMTCTPNGSIRKAGSALRPILLRQQGLRVGPINLSKAPRGRGQTEIRVRTTREAISPPAFLGANLTCSQDIYTGINGRRKLYETELITHELLSSAQILI